MKNFKFKIAFSYISHQSTYVYIAPFILYISPFILYITLQSTYSPFILYITLQSTSLPSFYISPFSLHLSLHSIYYPSVYISLPSVYISPFILYITLQSTYLSLQSTSLPSFYILPFSLHISPFSLHLSLQTTYISLQSTFHSSYILLSTYVPLHIYPFQSRLEALNQILELLSTEKDEDVVEDVGSFANSVPIVTSTTLLNSVHLQFLAGCFGLSVMNTEMAANTQLYHYQVNKRYRSSMST